MSDVAKDMADRLVAQSIGTFAGTSGWGIYISSEPVSPDTVITIYNTGGVDEPNPKWRLESRSFQIRVRGDENGYVAAYAKAEAIKNQLLGLGDVTINGTYYIGIWMTINIMFLMYDDSRRPIFVMSFRAECEPSESDNRTAL